MPSHHSIQANQQIPSSSALYIIFGTQVGLDYLTFQRKLTQAVGQDAWIALLITALLIHLAIWWMFTLLNRQQADLATINKRLLGTWIGALFNTALIVYFLLICMMSIRLYSEIVRIWIFPTIHIWVLELILLLLSYYLVSGGLRVIAGFFMFSQLFIVLNGIFYFLRNYYHPTNLLPIMTHTIPEISQAVWSIIPSFMGVEALLMFYPYLNNGKKAQRWSHGANAITMTVYLIILVFTLMFFSQEQLKDEMWPTLTLFKFVEFPFMERVEFIGATFQLSRVTPILSLYLWSALQTSKQQFRFSKRRMLPVYLVIVFIGSLMFHDVQQVLKSYSIIGQVGFVLLFVYVPLLIIVTRWLPVKGKGL
ncbi:GerAB/ArcD/ProY family transporter [Paenibacillus mendelii]|uniref:GerAB/ArcD/ProY family transporter n=1 Tax=Paenibacillus mendelii TaxID=206163 RepID=A0ABV6J1S9_9BACL|nr:GerAB/ArcD/ProY family transporter [Paenibacillus mendelii]MCQ6562762.1 spore germination protein [Paenibacillus mendelii]